MNEKIIIRDPLFIVPNENKSNVLKYEEDNNFNNERNDATNLINHINTLLPYKRNNKLNNDTNEVSLDLNEKENMNCFLNKKKLNYKIKSNDNNVIQSYRKGEINTSYNIMDNMYDIYYTNKSNKNLNDYLKHININHTAPCVGEFRTCMNCFLNISTLFCKTCNIFLCAICNIKLHKNNSNHVINVASSGLYENNIKYNDIILQEKDKWLVELDNSVPIKIKERCPIHPNEYIKYVCKTCKYTLLCVDCLLLDSIHVKHKDDEDDGDQENDNTSENINNNINSSSSFTKLSDNSKNLNYNNKCSNNCNSSTNSILKNNYNLNNEKQNDKQKIQLIVSLNKSDNNDITENVCNNDISNLKPGFKLIRGNHEIFTLMDARNEIKEELNDKLEILCKKSLVLKNTLPSLSNIYKYGKITCKNNKKCIRSCFTVTNSFLEKKKMKLYDNLKVLQDKSTDFLRKLDEERTNYKNYLEKKRNEIQHMIKLSNKNAGLALDYYVEKLESFRSLFFTKDNLVDIPKKLEIPHSMIKSENLPLLIEKLESEILNLKKNITSTSHNIRNQFQYLFSSNIEIPIYPAHFQNFLQKRTFNKEKEPLNKLKKKQQYFHILPFTDFYMNIKITYQQKFMRKDPLHQKWELRTISIRSIYMCIHSHHNDIDYDHYYDHKNILIDNQNKIKDNNFSSIEKENNENNTNNLNEKETTTHQFIKSGDESQSITKKEEKEEYKEKNKNQSFHKNIVNNLSNDIESIISLSNVNIKTFNDPDITNITILEKRNYPYGIELTEYNEKNDLVGYWLLTNENESVINELFNIINNIKKDNTKSPIIPSFHPKINMNSPFFNYHENNISTIYKHFSANIIEESYMDHFKNNLKYYEGKYLGKNKNKGYSIDTLCGSYINDNLNDDIFQNSSLLYAYDYFNDSKYSKSLNEISADDFTNESSISKLYEKLKKENDANSLDSSTFSKNNQHNKLTQLKRNNLQEESIFMSSKEYNNNSLKELRTEDFNLTYNFKQANKNISNKEDYNATILRKIEEKNEKNSKYDRDINIDIVKRNLIDEGKHLLPLYSESNILNNYNLSDICSNYVNIDENDDETKMEKNNFFNSTTKNTHVLSDKKINNIIYIKKETDFTDISIPKNKTEEIVNNNSSASNNDRDKRNEVKNYELQNSNNTSSKYEERTCYSKNNLKNENNLDIYNDTLKNITYNSSKNSYTECNIKDSKIQEDNKMNVNINSKNNLLYYMNSLNKSGKLNDDENIKVNNISNVNSYINKYDNNNDNNSITKHELNPNIFFDQPQNSDNNNGIKMDKNNINPSYNTELDRKTHIEKLTTEDSNSCDIKDLKNIITTKINHLELLTNKYLTNRKISTNSYYNVKDEKNDVYNNSYDKNMKTTDLLKLDEVQEFLQKLNNSDNDYNDINSKNILKNETLNKKKNNEISNSCNVNDENNFEKAKNHIYIDGVTNNDNYNVNYVNTYNSLEKHDNKHYDNDYYNLCDNENKKRIYDNCIYFKNNEQDTYNNKSNSIKRDITDERNLLNSSENKNNTYILKYNDMNHEVCKKNMGTNEDMQCENIQNNSTSSNSNYINVENNKSLNLHKDNNFIKKDKFIQRDNDTYNISEYDNKIYLTNKKMCNSNNANYLNNMNNSHNEENVNESYNLNNLKNINENLNDKNDKMMKSYIISKNNNTCNNKLDNLNDKEEEEKTVQNINDENNTFNMSNQDLLLCNSLQDNSNDLLFKVKSKEDMGKIKYSQIKSSFIEDKKVSLESDKNNENNFKSINKYENKNFESFQINGKTKMTNDLKKIQEKIESKVKKYKLEIIDKNKAPPSKKKKNNFKHAKTKKIEISNDNSTNVINKVLSQIGNKKLGS
ncbi:conserved Plasmodium protein, unknown function [Plasmodium gallinaceum]|uniref:B box-type domain-containing protein n=1 Tax=Plasmodium gallinaceum TaxID=5849 RepID=A0A1J1GWB9_PLAGA|nr:conserved Plasmodium protein, unknown function [Plasmodium gallinaceum]CRG95309.1 conserved Plasmodium protein, unknown function [Plasmodium gallinaceum]